MSNTVHNSYLPSPPVKWTTSLDEANKDDMVKFDRWKAQADKQAKQEEAATITADSVAKGIGNLASIAKFSKKLSDTLDTKAQEKFKINYIENVALEDRETLKKELLSKEIDLSKGSEKLIDQLDRSLYKPETIDFLEKNSARNSLRLRRVLGWEAVKYGIADLDYRMENSKNKDVLQTNYEIAVQAGRVSEFIQEDIYEKLDKLGFNNKYIAANFKSEVERISETKGAAATLEYKNVKLAEEAVTDINTLKNLQPSDNETKADLATFTLQGLLKRNGKLKVAGFLHRALKDGQIDSDIIYAMQDGVAKDFPGGDGKEGSGEKLFDQKTWEYILSGANDANRDRIAKAQTKGESQAVAMLGELYKPNSQYQTQEQWNEAILPLKGMVSEKTYRNLENQNYAAQGIVQEKRYLNDFAEDRRNGTLHLRIEDIKEIPNTKVRTLLLDEAKKVKEWTEKPGNEIAYDEDTAHNEVYTARAGKAFDKSATVISNKDRIVAQDLVSFRRQDLTKRILAQYGPEGQFTPNPNIATENAQALETYKQLNGWGQNDGAGKFSLTGTFNKEWGNYFNTGHSTGYDHNAPLSSNAAKTYNDKLRSVNYNKDTLYNQVDGIFTVDQLVGFYRSGKVSKDMQYIRSRDGSPMSDLIEKASKALVAHGGKEYKDIIERYNINESSGEFPTPDRIISAKLDEAIANSSGSLQHDGENIRTLLKWYGFESLTTNQASRLLDILDKQQSPKNITTQAGDDARKVRVKRLLDLGIGTIPDGFEHVIETEKDFQEYYEQQKEIKKQIKKQAEEFKNSPAGIAVADLEDK